MLLFVATGLRAQTFTVPNDDGVDIKYTVQSTQSQMVMVDGNNYSGRVVVPSTVSYNDTVWTVSGVLDNAFKQRPVTYVRFPETVTVIGYHVFYGCTSLDTLCFDSEAPAQFSHSNITYVFGSSFDFESVVVLVPCGHLAQWKASKWARLKWLTTDCAHRLTVIPTIENVARVDSVVVNSSVNYSNGMFEAGDNAILSASLDWKCFLLGWSDGSKDLVHTYEMPDHDDTVICYVDTVHFASLSTNAITTPVYQYGSLSYDGSKCNYVFNAYDESPSTIFATGLWIGTPNGVAIQKFSSKGYDFYPGPLRTTDGTTDMATIQRYNRVWHVTREMIDYHIAHCGEDGYVIPDDIMTWPGTGTTEDGFAEQLAPFYDADDNGRYWAPAGDYPLIRGDECVYSIFNDAWGPHLESGSEPLGIEVHCMTYAFNEPQDSVLWNSIFVHYDIYNRSGNSYDDTYLGAWTDFDIGVSYDDFIGCDIQNNMYYGYNGSSQDQFFGYYIPVQGCLILGADDDLGMTSFLVYDNSTSGVNGEPTIATDYYNYLRGYWRNGTAVTYGGNGMGGDMAYQFMYPANSDTSVNYWDEISAGNIPGDRRGVGSSGPFTFENGTCHQFDLAYLASWSQDTGCVGCGRVELIHQAPILRNQWLRDTTDSGRPFTYRPYSAPHQVALDGITQPLQRLYPNPTTGIITIELSQAADMQIFDMMGRLLISKHLPAGFSTLDLNTLPQGIYLFRSGGTTQRIVKK